MNYIFLLLFFILLLTILLFTVALRIRFIFDSENENANLTFFWLNSLIRGLFTYKNSKPILEIYFLNKRVYRTTVKKSKNKPRGMELAKLVKPRDIHINTHYGFRDPFTTGVACGAINIASQFINIDSLNQFPNFLADDDYIYLNATAKVNMGSTLLKLFRARNTNP